METFIVYLTFIVIAGLVFALMRLSIGPHLIDRIAAADAVLLLTVCMVLLMAIKFEEPAYIQSAVAVSVFAFLGNLVFAKIISPRSVGEPEDEGEEESAHDPETGDREES